MFVFLALLSQLRPEKVGMAVGTARGSQLLSCWDIPWGRLPGFCPPECSATSCASVSLSVRSWVSIPHSLWVSLGGSVGEKVPGVGMLALGKVHHSG